MPTPEATVDVVPATPAPLVAAVAELRALPVTAQEAAPGRSWRAAIAALEAGNTPTDDTPRNATMIAAARHNAIAIAQQRLITNTASSAIWNAWTVCDWHGSATNVTTNDANVWNAWNTVGTSSTSCGCTTVIDTAVWGAWNSGPRQTLYRAAPTIEATEEQKARWETERIARETRENAYRAEQAEREKKRQAEQAEADHKAKRLLVECLSPEQRDTLEKHNYFDVKLPSGATYRIHKGWSHNVKRVKPDGTVDRGTFCAHPADMVPHYDNMLAQKFMLETDEQAFLRVANRG
jgi:hypothetical protein